MSDTNAPTTTIVNRLTDAIIEQFPVHRGFLNNAAAFATADEMDRLSGYLEFCMESKGLSIDYLAECYLTILGDTLDEQTYFRDHGHYRHSTFAEVAESVYHDRDYMDRYMYGLAISTFLWPNHVAMARLLRRTVPGRSGRYLEVGPGHGFLLLSAMQLGDFQELLGIDLSEASVQQTRSIVEHFQPGAPVRIEKRDFFEAGGLEPSSFDAVVAGEVLEHVEQPGIFLRRIAELATDDAYIFVTTCINAPAVDHIFLWRTTDELEQLIADSGLEIVEPLRLPYEGKTLEECREEALPINVAYVLRKVPA